MNRVFVAGDTHGGAVGDAKKLTSRNFKEGKELTKDDYVIILGDFGYVWDVNGPSKRELYDYNWFGEKHWTTLFVDGNHCFSRDTEVLTEEGWKNISYLIDNKISIKIAQFDISTKEISFDYPLRDIKDKKEEMISFEGNNISQLVSKKHDMIINDEKVKAEYLLDKKIKEESLILTGNNDNKVDIEDDWIRLLTWVIMDATIIDYSKYNQNSNKKTVQFHLSKERKINELSSLLKKMGLPFTIKVASKSGINKLQPYYIRIYSDTAREIIRRLKEKKEIPFEWRNFSSNQVEVFLDILKITDGTVNGKNIIWHTTSENDTDIVQEMCIKNGYVFKKNLNENSSGFDNGKPSFRNRISLDKGLLRNHYIKIEKIKYNDYSYCYTMPKGTLIVRRNGKVNFSGNCNFDRLDKLPEEEKFGGKVGKLTDSIYHLKRGEVYTIGGKTFFTFGGGTSIDKARRTEGISWWAREAPNDAEYKNGLNNLEKYNNKVDYILTHDCSERTLDRIHGKAGFNGFRLEITQLQKFLDLIEKTVDFNKWYFGHFHQDFEIDNKHEVLYNTIKEVNMI